MANNLLNAESAEVYWRAHNGAIAWQTFATFKAEIDRLTVCDLNAAHTLSTRLTELAAHSGNPLSQAFADAGRARVLHQEGHHREANALYEKAVKVLRRARLSTEAAMIQKQQVAALKYLGRFSDALKTARAARRTLSKGSAVQLAQLETNVGNVYYQLDQYRKALTHYDRAHELFSASGEEAMQAQVDFSRANIFTELDQPDKALQLLDSAAATFERQGQSLNAAQSRFHIAYIQFLKGNYNLALALYYDTREQLQSLGNRQLVAWCDLEIAEILLALNAFEDAMENAAKARQHFRELGMDYEAAKATMTQALAAVGLQQFDNAQSDLLEAREAFAQQKNKTFTGLADAYLAELAIERRDYPEAVQRAEASWRVFSRQKLPIRSAYACLLAARAAYKAGRLTKSARLVHAALQTVEERYAPSIAFKSHHLKGQLEQAQGRPALPHFRRAVAEIERMRSGVATDEFKTLFLRDKIEAYEDAINACLDESSRDPGSRTALVEEVFQLVESAKSRSLADLIGRYVRQGQTRPADLSENLSPTGSLKSELQTRLDKLIEDLNWYNSHAGLEEDKGDQRRADVAERYQRQVAHCEKQIAHLFRRLQSESLLLAERQQISTSGLTPDVNDLRAALATDETAIEYFITGDEVSAFIASGDEIKIVRNLASKRDIEKILAAWRFQIEKFNYGEAYVDAHFGQLKRATDGHLAQLYQALWAPIAEPLTNRKLVIIPHGVLHYLPFHALRDGTDYLVDRYEISYAPSATVFSLCRRQGATKKAQGIKPHTAIAPALGAKIDMVALGVSESGTPSIDDEIQALGSLFPNAVKLVGDQATQKNLNQFAPAARFLHLASHGYFRRDNPMFSFLKLADTNLNFYNLIDLQLTAELVTLSACHTGVNAIFPGDELHGLMRGFLSAGAPSMVVSLWAVNDQSTTDLMSEMYRRIKAGESKRVALRQAQLAAKESYGHPYYWAPFILMGETGETSEEKL